MKTLKDKDQEYKMWVCRKCGHEVHAVNRPQPINWTDGHRCIFYLEPEDKQ